MHDFIVLILVPALIGAIVAFVTVQILAKIMRII